MDSVCPKCGSAVAAGAGYCPACGAAVAPAEPFAAGGYAPVNLPPVNTPPNVAGPYPGVPAAYAGPVPAKGGGGLKIVLIIVAIIVGIIVLGVGIVGYGVYKVAHSVKTDSKGNVSWNVPGGGGMSIGQNVTATEDELGVPVYPGAARGPGGMRVKNKATSMIMVVYKTNADVDDVISFYKGKMPDAVETTNSGKHSAVLKQGSEADQITVVVSPPAGQDSSGTNIMITRVQQPGK